MLFSWIFGVFAISGHHCDTNQKYFLNLLNLWLWFRNLVLFFLEPRSGSFRILSRILNPMDSHPVLRLPHSISYFPGTPIDHLLILFWKQKISRHWHGFQYQILFERLTLWINSSRTETPIVKHIWLKCASGWTRLPQKMCDSRHLLSQFVNSWIFEGVLPLFEGFGAGAVETRTLWEIRLPSFHLVIMTLRHLPHTIIINPWDHSTRYPLLTEKEKRPLSM